jgi:hypothetical protein
MLYLSRRDFTHGLIGSLGTFLLVKTVSETDALARPIKEITLVWLNELEQLGRDLKERKSSPTVWQQKVEELFARIDLNDFFRSIDFDRLSRKMKFQSNHESILVPDRISGHRTDDLLCTVMLEGLKKDQAIVPHGHRNMATFHMVLSGELYTRCYERVDSDPTHMLIKPAIDEAFGPGKLATMSDDRLNVHWFKALSPVVFAFNVGVYGVNPNANMIGREYVNPEAGERLEGGVIRAPRLTQREAYKLFGGP